jgi:hypothetical protein
MNRLVLALGMSCLVTVNVGAQQDVGKRVIDAFERGSAERMAQEAHKSDLKTGEAVREYYRQQIKLLETQNRLLEQQLRESEEKDRQKAQYDAVAAKVDADLQLFTARHPNWKAIEPQMVCLGSSLSTTNLESQEYMELLYLMAKSEVWNKQCGPQSPASSVPAASQEP